MINAHEKLVESIQQMLIDVKVNLPYYGNFNLFVNFHENDSIGTCGVNITQKGMNFYYSPTFLNRMSQKEVNFITLHEDFHLLWDHPKRTITGQYDHKLANIAQDMIINHVIWQDIPNNYVEIPKDEEGKNMALFLPVEYTGKLIFEEVYEFLKEAKEKKDKEKKDKGESGNGDPQNGDSNDSEKGDSNGKGGGKKYGPYGKNPKNENETIDTWSLDDILDNLDSNEGQYLDVHMTDEIPEEMRGSIIKDAMDRLQARGLASGNIEATLNKLRKKKKDYLSYIKRTVSNLIFGTKKTKTITKPNRRQISGMKGTRKVKNKINVILDTSGSMGGTFERVLSFIYQSDIECNLIEADTQVKWVQNIKSKRHLETIPIKGLGGTALMPAVDYVVQNFNKFNTLILTDGYCDSLDLSKLKGSVLIISIGTRVPISTSNNKLKQIILDPDE